MTLPSHSSITAQSNSARELVHDWIEPVVRVLLIYAEAARRAHAAAALHDSLSRVSDCELARSAITRADINRRVFDLVACETGPAPGTAHSLTKG